MHKHYIELGGQFVETHEKDRRLKIAQKKFESKKRKPVEKKEEKNKGK